MRRKIINNGLQDVMVLIASEGKVFRRIGTDEIFGDELTLGFSHYINGVKQVPPHQDIPEDFEEVDAPPEEEETLEELDLQ